MPFGTVRPVQIVDALLAPTFLVVELVEIVPGLTDDGFQAGPRWWNIAGQIAFVAPLVVRRRNPRACFVALHGLLLLSCLAGDRSLFFFAHELPSLLVTYTVARYDGGRVGRWAWCSGLVLTASMFAAAPPEIARRELSSPVLFVLCSVVAWGCGRLVRRMREQGAALQAALRRLAGERMVREAAAVTAERSRIALEMHDVVVAAVTRMTRQIAATRTELEAAGRTVPRLSAAEETGRQALRELRRTLDVLDGAGDGPDGAVPVDTPPGLEATDELGERFRAAGLDLQLSVDAPPDLPLGLELAVYRILQEALTNVLKHGGRDDVRAAVLAVGGELVIRVRNRVPDEITLGAHGARVPSGRHGLVGMRERLAMFGGRLHVESSPAVFELTAALPLPATTSSATTSSATTSSATTSPAGLEATSW